MNPQDSLLKTNTKRPGIILPVVLFLLMFGFAISVTMIAPMLEALIEHYGLDMSHSGLIMTFQGVGGVLAIALGGIIADLTKKSKLISISFIIYSLSMIFIALSPSYTILLGLFFILGASTRMLDTVVNAFVSDVYQDRRGFYLTLLHAFFGVGAFAGPLFSVVLINRGVKWNYIFLILGITCVLIVTLYIISIRKVPVQQEAVSTDKTESIFSLIVNPELLILCLIMFLYSGYQSGISFWLPMYMENELNANPLLSSFALSAFWVGIIASRFLCSFLTKKYDAKYLILFGLLISGIVLILGIVINVPVVLLIASGISGFLSGATIPLLIMTGCNWYPKNSGTVSSMIFFFGTLSYIIFPWLMGKIADVISFKWGMQLTGILLLIAVVFAFIIPRAKENVTQV